MKYRTLAAYCDSNTEIQKDIDIEISHIGYSNGVLWAYLNEGVVPVEYLDKFCSRYA